MFNHRVGVLAIAASLLTLGATSAGAYQFGPPPITELAEVGGTQNRLSLYSQTTNYDGDTMTPALQGISYASSTGDRTGSSSSMFRLAKYSDNRSVYRGYTDSTGVLIGGGLGGQWYFGSQRNFGLLLNGQLDYLTFNNDVKLNNGSKATLDYSQLAYGIEVGALYRYFISTATVTPFVTAMKGARTRKISTTSSCTNCAADYSYADDATTVGLDFMMGKFSASLLQTNASYVAKVSGSSVTSPAQKSTISMIVLGMNF